MPNTDKTKLEQVFSDIAYAHLRDKSNSLLDYLLGFQLLKTEDDGKRAVGIFGFEIDDKVYYAPAFFLNGEIRGLDCIYSVDSDLFVPMTDELVDSLINRADVAIGEKDNRSKRDRGVREPSYQQLRIVPGGRNVKLGSAGAVFDDVIAGFNTDGGDVMPLPEQLRLLGKSASGFIADIRSNRKLASAVNTFYSMLDLMPAAERQQKVAAEASAEKPVIIVGSITDEGVEQLTDEQRKQVIEGGVAVLDLRGGSEKSTVYKTEAARQLVTPTDPAVYDILMADGSVRAMLCLPTAVRRSQVLAYDLKDKRWCLHSCNCINAVRQYGNAPTREQLLKFPEPSEAKVNKTYAFVSLSGHCSIPYEVTERLDGMDGSVVLRVRQAHYYDPEKPVPHHWQPDPMPMNSRTQAAEDTVQIIITPDRVSVPRYYKNKLVISDRHFRAIELRSATEDSDIPAVSDKAPSAYLTSGDFGDFNTVVEQLAKEAQALDVWSQGDDIMFKAAGEVITTDRRGAYDFLIKECGAGVDDVEAVLGELSYVKTSYYVKRAARLEFEEPSEPTMGGEMSQFHRTAVPETLVVKDNAPDGREAYEYESPFSDSGDGESGGKGTTLARIQAAVATGDKDVFDATSLMTLIKSYNPTDLVDRYMPSITVGMDRIGRILFLIYWHYKDFSERYGEDEISEIIDGLRSVFEQLGDMVINLKERTMAGDPEHYGLGLSPELEVDHG